VKTQSEKIFVMFSVALIGPDGAGKTTIARMLQERSPLPLKYIYMGENIGASNFALPTSRVLEYFRGRQNGNREPATGLAEVPAPKPAAKSRGAFLWLAGRLANLLADEWYRQLCSWGYQCAGFIALYDRHYLFDYSLKNVDLDEEGFDTRLHRWFLTHAYPRPNLVIYLDAPAEVLFARKGEKNVQELETRRQSFLQLMKTNSNCYVVDATQPLSKVYEDVAARIFSFYKLRTRKPFPESEAVSESPAPVQPDPDPLSESMR
jgi:thymidylate kinase